MIAVAPGTRVYLACRPVSMRFGFDGLAAQVAHVLDVDPYSGHLFLFRSKRADYLKWRCCMGRRDGRVDPSPNRGSGDANGVRAPQLHMWTASSSQGVLQCFDQIACVHMSGLT